MSENQYDDLFDDDTQGQQQQEANTPKALREAYEKAKRENAALQEELQRIRDAEAEHALRSKIEGAGLPEKAFQWAKLELGQDVSDEKVASWVEENKGIFGGAKEAPVEADAPATKTPTGQPSVSPEQAAQIQAMQDVGTGHFDPSTVAPVVAAMERVVEGTPKNASFESVIQSLNAAARQAQQGGG